MRKRAQSILEYTLLVAVVSAVLISMYEYVYRAINAKLKDVQDAVYEQGLPGVNKKGK